MLFDPSATCSYVSTKFAREHNLPITPRRVPIDTSSPLGNIRCTKRCQEVNITIEGHPFLADLTLLPSDGLDVILGMDWLTRHQGVISCSPRYVEITHPSGHVIQCEPNHEKMVSMLCAMEAKSVEEVLIVCEYPDVFLEELPGMPPDQDVEFMIDLLPGMRPMLRGPTVCWLMSYRSSRNSSRSCVTRGTLGPMLLPGVPLYYLRRRKMVP